jgi:hypothetical protein
MIQHMPKHHHPSAGINHQDPTVLENRVIEIVILLITIGIPAGIVTRLVQRSKARRAAVRQ